MSSDQINLYLVTFNCARVVASSSFTEHFLDGLKFPIPNPNNRIQVAPDIIALSIQEIAPLSDAFIGGIWLDEPYFSSYVKAVQEGARKTLMEEYSLIAKNNVGMEAIMIFARGEVVKNVRGVEYGGVGVGLWEMGNKAGVGVRLYYAAGEEVQPVVLNFVGAHLAPHEWNIEKRSGDWERIVKGMVFVGPDGQITDQRYPGIYSPRAHVFVMGDLNYRTSSTRPTFSDQSLFPQPHDKKTDPSHIDNLWRLDQLTRELKRGRAFHGFEEPNKKGYDHAPFPPTYKFKVTGDENRTYDENYWDWEEKRWPSWTDRILIHSPPAEEIINSSNRITVHNYDWIPHVMSSDHKPVALCASIPSLSPLSPSAPLSTNVEYRDFRVNPPLPLNEDWKERRVAARMREVAVGIAAFLTSTRTGVMLTLSTLAITLGSLWFLQAEFAQI